MLGKRNASLYIFTSLEVILVVFAFQVVLIRWTQPILDILISFDSSVIQTQNIYGVYLSWMTHLETYL